MGLIGTLLVVLVFVLWTIFLLTGRQVDYGFEGDALTIGQEGRLLSHHTRIPFNSIRKVELFRPVSRWDRFKFLLLYFPGSLTVFSRSEMFLLLTYGSRELALSPPDPEGFAAELEARKADWMEGPKRGKWGLG